MFRDAALIASKDLRIELRSKVGLNQIVPFAGVVVILFGFALDSDPAILSAVAGGLFWVAVLFSSVLAVQHSYAIESADGAGESLRLAGIDPAGIFLGKASAVAVQLFVLQGLLACLIAVVFHAHFHLASPGSIAVLAGSSILATIGISSAGTIYGAIATSTRVSDTLLPLLFLPIVSPVLLCATQAWQHTLGGSPAQGAPWLRILGVFSAVYLVAGIFSYESIMEMS